MATFKDMIEQNLKEMSLQDITTVTLNTDILKHNFEVIIEILRKLGLEKDENAEKIKENSLILLDLKERMEKLEKQQ